MSAKGQSENPRPRPQVGASLARGRAVKTGRTLTLAQAEVFAKTGGQADRSAHHRIHGGEGTRRHQRRRL